eukprot:scaffold174737_cov40-Prasinocladus_malaysianus.AAC.1
MSPFCSWRAYVKEDVSFCDKNGIPARLAGGSAFILSQQPIGVVHVCFLIPDCVASRRVAWAAWV